MSPKSKTTSIGIERPNSPMFILLDEQTCDLQTRKSWRGAAGSCGRRFKRLDGKRESFDADYFYGLASRNGLRRGGAPQFSVDANHALGGCGQARFGGGRG